MSCSEHCRRLSQGDLPSRGLKRRKEATLRRTIEASISALLIAAAISTTTTTTSSSAPHCHEGKYLFPETTQSLRHMAAKAGENDDNAFNYGPARECDNDNEGIMGRASPQLIRLKEGTDNITTTSTPQTNPHSPRSVRLQSRHDGSFVVPTNFSCPQGGEMERSRCTAEGLAASMQNEPESIKPIGPSFSLSSLLLPFFPPFDSSVSPTTTTLSIRLLEEEEHCENKNCKNNIAARVAPTICRKQCFLHSSSKAQLSRPCLLLEKLTTSSPSSPTPLISTTTPLLPVTRDSPATFLSLPRRPAPTTLLLLISSHISRLAQRVTRRLLLRSSPRQPSTFFPVITFAAATPASDPTTTNITFAFSATTLLSGSVTACHGSLTAASCAGGLASLLAYSRAMLRAGTTDYVIAVPEIDTSTPFVQMHPNGLSVNIDVFRTVGVDTYTLKPSLLSSRASASYDRLYTEAAKPVMTNSRVAADDDWYEYLKYRRILEVPVGGGSGGTAIRVGFLYITPSQQSFSSPSVAALAAAMRGLKRDSDVTVVLYQDREVVGKTALSELSPAVRPTILLDVSDKAFPLMLEATAPVGGTDGAQWHATAQIDSYGIFLTLNVQSTTTPANPFASSETLTHTAVGAAINISTLAKLPSDLMDTEYFDLQRYLLNLSRAASTNDPELAKVLDSAAPSRVNGFYPCFAGECAQGTLTVRALAAAWDADIGFMNSGGPRGPGWAAPTTLKTSDVWAMYTFADTTCRGTIQGLKVWELVNVSMAFCTFSSAHSSIGDRFLQFYGLEIDYDTGPQSIAAGTRVRAIRVLDRETNTYKPLERLKYYTFATTTYDCTGMPETSPVLLRPRTGETITDIASGDLVQIHLQNFLRSVGTNGGVYEPVMRHYLRQSPTLATTTTEFMRWAQSKDSCARTFLWDEGIATCVPCPVGKERDSSDATRCVDGPETSMLVAILIPIVAAALVLAAAMTAFVTCRYRGQVRDNKNAPKGPTAAIVFTDVQMSTQMWGTVPASMAVALDQHHDLIRAAIRRHGGYEVKTIGDSFMIAVDGPRRAAELALAIQTDFAAVKWPRCIDQVYAAQNDAHLSEIIEDDPDDMIDVTSPPTMVEQSISPSLGLLARQLEHSQQQQQQQQLLVMAGAERAVFGTTNATGAASGNLFSTSMRKTIVNRNSVVALSVTPAHMTLAERSLIGGIITDGDGEAGGEIGDLSAAPALTSASSNNNNNTFQLTPQQEGRAASAPSPLPLPPPTIAVSSPAGGPPTKAFASSAAAGVNPLNTATAAGGGAPIPYRRPFIGLRVRIGIHYGPVSPTFDEIAKGYDYYGGTVNIAARLEAIGHGGQIIVSKEVLNGAKIDAEVATAKGLGAKQLKGVEGTTEVFELTPVALADRKFDERIVTKDGEVEDAETSSTLQRSDRVTVPLTETEVTINQALLMSLRPLTQHERAAHLTALTRGWRIEIPRHTPAARREKTVLAVVAQRLAAATHQRQRLGIHMNVIAGESSIATGNTSQVLHTHGSATGGPAFAPVAGIATDEDANNMPSLNPFAILE